MRPKFIFLDLDGVLVLQSPWEKLHEFVGIPPAQTREWLRANLAGELSSKQWIDNITPYYRAFGLRREHCYEAFMDISINPEAYDLVVGTGRRGIPTAIISGGLNEYVSLVASELGIGTWHAYARACYDADGVFDRFDVLDCDTDVKVREVQAICAREGIDPTETLCVGDSYNDIGVFNLTQHGVLYRSNDPRHVTHAWRTTDDLREVLRFIDAYA